MIIVLTRVSRVMTEVCRVTVRSTFTLLAPTTSRLLSTALTVVHAVRSTVLAAATSCCARDRCSILAAYWQPRTFWRMDSDQTPTGPEHHGPQVDTQQAGFVQPQVQMFKTKQQDYQSRSQVSFHTKYQGEGWSKHSRPTSQY